MTDTPSKGERVARVAAEPRVAILGAGPGGMAAAYRLREAGFKDITIYERNDGFGGVWRQNTYPGLTCDVMSYFYSFSFAPNKEWTQPYASQPEILAYIEKVAKDTGLDAYLRTGVTITSLAWDDATVTWTIAADSGETFHANIVVSALGLFNEPNVAELAGRETFEGTQFHSMRWDHQHDLSGERVAVIGTGASAIQFVPEIAPLVGQLTVFQREPGWIFPKADTPYTERQRQVMRRVPLAARYRRLKIWLTMERTVVIYPGTKLQRVRTQLSKDFLERSVADPGLRAKLQPRYDIGCKRLLPTNAWYPALQRENVELESQPISQIKAHSIVTADGRERDIDTIIWGTGFTSSKYLSAVEVTGRDGRSLHDVWRSGVRAYLGMTHPGFPNLFMLYGPNTNGTTSVFHILEAQVRYLTMILKRMRRSDAVAVEVTADTLDRYDAEVQRRLAGTVWDGGCSHSYFKDEHGKIRTQFPYRFSHYWLMTWRVRRRDYRWRLAGARP